jgi:hypothetical protein
MAKRPRGPQPNWRPNRPRTRALLADITARYQQHRDEGTLPRGGRGIFYDLRPHGLGNGLTYTKITRERPQSAFGPMEASQKNIQEVLQMARRAGIIRESWVADDRAPDPLTPWTFTDADDYAAWVAEDAKQFQLDRQRGQDCYVEVACEPEGLGPRLALVAEPYGVPVYPSGGYGGLKGKRELATRAASRDVPTIVLVVTDYDDDGMDIYQSAREDAIAWVPYYNPPRPGCWLRFKRIAITRQQAIDNDALDDDGKAEADALPVQVMDRILTRWLDRLLDTATREQVLADLDREGPRP